MDFAARNEMVEANLGLVGYTIKNKINLWNQNLIEYDDAKSAGMEALVIAAGTYDEDKGSFANYAINCIANAIYTLAQKEKKQQLSIEKIASEQIRFTQVTPSEDELKTEVEQIFQDLKVVKEKAAINIGLDAILLLMDGYNYQEIGMKLNVDPVKVKDYVYKTRRMLKENSNIKEYIMERLYKK